VTVAALVVRGGRFCAYEGLRPAHEAKSSAARKKSKCRRGTAAGAAILSAPAFFPRSGLPPAAACKVLDHQA
jgi:hypothetical protein